jgi:single-stranded-DNA-specific exonuclease
MPLNVLNRSVVQRGMELMRRNPRRGLAALFDKLGIAPKTISEEQLSMRIIPCLNAPGRIGYADISVKALLGAGEIYNNVNDLIKANRKRQTISERIAGEICENGTPNRRVIFDGSWPVGVLSGVASRICSMRRSPVVLAAPIGQNIRGTLRVPVGANAVNILSAVSEYLEAWGGHRYAAGFSVSSARWPEVENRLEELLAGIQVEEEVVKAVALPPTEITLGDWRDVSGLGPFGNGNPCPYFYMAKNDADKIAPLGKDGKHCSVVRDDVKLLAFNAASDLEDTSAVTGWVYHPRIDFWRDEERVQFVLDYTVVAK